MKIIIRISQWQIFAIFFNFDHRNSYKLVVLFERCFKRGSKRQTSCQSYYWNDDKRPRVVIGPQWRQECCDWLMLTQVWMRVRGCVMWEIQSVQVRKISPYNWSSHNMTFLTPLLCPTLVIHPPNLTPKNPINLRIQALFVNIITVQNSARMSFEY